MVDGVFVIYIGLPSPWLPSHVGEVYLVKDCGIGTKKEIP
jgi:hypothetical protein